MTLQRISSGALLRVLGASVCLMSAAAAQTQTTKGKIPFSGTAPGQGTFGSADLTFKLYDAAAEGNFLNYSDSQLSVPVAPDDSFSARLGAGTGGDVPPNVFAANPSVFIAIELTSMPGVEIAPRVPLFSSAYAQNAASLGKPDGVSVVRGNLNLDSSTPTAGNILRGGSLFLHGAGFNTFLGFLSGNLTMIGVGNIGIGVEALRSNTRGGLNTAVGNSALGNNTIGNSNTATGFAALSNNTSGDLNTATGYYALQDNISGSYNTAQGSQALYHNISDGNTAIGYTALVSNTTGYHNTASGIAALYANNGYYNTATGANALRSNSTGFENTADGVQALYSNREGVRNTADGAYALYSNTSGNVNTAIGFNALRNTTIGSANIAVGPNALFNNTRGGGNIAIGDTALESNTTGTGNIAIGAYANVTSEDLVNATAIGYAALVDASDKIRLGNTSVRVIEGQVPYTYPSDRNQKENFQRVEGEEVLTKIRGMSLTSWNYKGQEAKQFRHYGPMAQDFFAAFGHDAVGTIGTPTTITSGDLDGILMVAAQALEKRTVEQEKQIADLKARLEALERRLGRKGRAGL